MATVDPNQQSAAVAQPVAQTAPVAAGGAGVAGGATKQAAATAGVNVPQQKSAQLSAYLNANAPQATALGANVAGQVGNQVSAAQNAILPAVNTYTGQLAVTPTNSTVNQEVATAPASLSAADQQAYQQELAASSQAPNSAATFETTQPYQNLTSQIQNTVEQANLWNAGNNTANLQTALQPYEAPQATTGDTTLDAYLLSSTPAAYSQIQQATAPAANLQNNLATATTQADQALQNAIATDTATTAAAQAAPQTFANNLTAYLNNAVSQATGNSAAQNSQILSDLQNNAPTQADLTALGITPAQWSTLSGYMAADNTPAVSTYDTNLGLQNTKATPTPINLTSYLTQPTLAINAANTATAQDYANVAALQSLLGANAPVEPINSTTASEAGTAPAIAAGNTFNLTGAEQAAQLAPLQAEAQAVQNYENSAIQQYGINHFGGQTPSQFNDFIAGLNQELGSLNQQMQNIQANTPGQAGYNGTNFNWNNS